LVISGYVTVTAVIILIIIVRIITTIGVNVIVVAIIVVITVVIAIIIGIIIAGIRELFDLGCDNHLTQIISVNYHHGSNRSHNTSNGNQY
jgi:hypothetical protein